MWSDSEDLLFWYGCFGDSGGCFADGRADRHVVSQRGVGLGQALGAQRPQSMLKFSWVPQARSSELTGGLSSAAALSRRWGCWGWEGGKPPGELVTELGMTPGCPQECFRVSPTRYGDILHYKICSSGWARADGFHGPQITP